LIVVPVGSTFQISFRTTIDAAAQANSNSDAAADLAAELVYEAAVTTDRVDLIVEATGSEIPGRTGCTKTLHSFPEMAGPTIERHPGHAENSSAGRRFGRPPTSDRFSNSQTC
jgi:hypothetical protein